MKPGRRTLLSLLFALATVAAIAVCIRVSLDPRQYFYYRSGDVAGWTWAPGHVAMFCGFMLAEALLVWGACVARRPPALRLRCALALALLLPWTLLVSMAVMHVPTYMLVHLLWAWLLVIALSLIAAGSAAGALYRRWRGGQAGDGSARNP